MPTEKNPPPEAAATPEVEPQGGSPRGSLTARVLAPWTDFQIGDPTKGGLVLTQAPMNVTADQAGQIQDAAKKHGVRVLIEKPDEKVEG